MRLVLLWLFLLGAPINHPDSIPDQKEQSEVSINPEFLQNKTIPKEIEKQVWEALSYFPELKEVDITFEFKEKINGAMMQAQPKVFSLFVDSKENRKYKVKITRSLKSGDELIPIEEVPHDALVGWIGHELGHIMDYLHRSSANMMRFGAKYFISKDKLVEAELTADGYAIGCGMGHQILANKYFILNNDDFEDSYKDKIRNLYMSPSQILSLQEALEVVD